MTTEFMYPSTEMPNLKISGAVIRIDPDLGVYIHSNSSHHTVGVTKAYIDTGDGSLVVERDASDAVVTVSVTPDETITSRDITCGLSGGGSISKVFFYKNGTQLKLNGPTGYAAIASSVSNIWFMVVHH